MIARLSKMTPGFRAVYVLLTSLCLIAPTSLSLPVSNLGNCFTSFLCRKRTEVTGLRETACGLSSSSLARDLGFDPFDSIPKSRS